jgi:hypothetical protein
MLLEFHDGKMSMQTFTHSLIGFEERGGTVLKEGRGGGDRRDGHCDTPEMRRHSTGE